mgnify:CR=1 FL=1
MALVIDTRFLLAYTFPSTIEDRRLLYMFFQNKILKENTVIPSIVVTEYLKIAGRIIGSTPSEVQVKRFERVGVKIEPILDMDSYVAGKLLLKNPDVPIAEALIAAVAKRLKAKVVTNDPHYKVLGVKTIWYK